MREIADLGKMRNESGGQKRVERVAVFDENRVDLVRENRREERERRF